MKMERGRESRVQFHGKILVSSSVYFSDSLSSNSRRPRSLTRLVCDFEIVAQDKHVHCHQSHSGIGESAEFTTGVKSTGTPKLNVGTPFDMRTVSLTGREKRIFIYRHIAGL